MSSKKYKKGKKFSVYPKMEIEINKTSEEMDIPITEVIEAACAFFIRCPAKFQDRLYRHYKRNLRDWLCEDDDKIDQLIPDAEYMIMKNNDAKES